MADVCGQSDYFHKDFITDVSVDEEVYPLNIERKPDRWFGSRYGLRIQTMFSLADICGL